MDLRALNGRLSTAGPALKRDLLRDYYRQERSAAERDGRQGPRQYEDRPEFANGGKRPPVRDKDQPMPRNPYYDGWVDEHNWRVRNGLT